MSLFSTITHGEVSPLKGVSPRGVGVVALILAIGMAVGYAAANIDLTAETPQTQVAGPDHGAFLELNTADLEWLKPMLPAKAQARAAAKVDQFVWANVDSYAALNEPWSVESAFTKANTDLGVFGPYDPVEAERLLPFITVNVAAYDSLTGIWEEAHTVDPTFVELNTNLPQTYVEPQSGPR